MPDLRTVLTETLRGHALHSVTGNDWGCNCGERFTHLPDFYGHQAEALLSLPGVAVTQLPEAQADPEYGDPYWPVELEGETYPGKLRIDYGYRSGPRIALIGIPTPLRVADVPNLTAALLSAAAAVVLSEGETR